MAKDNGDFLKRLNVTLINYFGLLETAYCYAVRVGLGLTL